MEWNAFNLTMVVCTVSSTPDLLSPVTFQISSSNIELQPCHKPAPYDEDYE